MGKLTFASRFVLCVAAMVHVPLALAHADVPNAGMVSSACRQEAQGTMTAYTASTCTFLIRGFIDGYLAGAKRGLSVAFTQDEKNLRTTRGANDVMARINAIQDKATCFDGGAKVSQIGDAFVQYMAAHPDAQDKPYYVPMAQMVYENVCH